MKLEGTYGPESNLHLPSFSDLSRTQNKQTQPLKAKKGKEWRPLNSLLHRSIRNGGVEEEEKMIVLQSYCQQAFARQPTMKTASSSSDSAKPTPSSLEDARLLRGRLLQCTKAAARRRRRPKCVWGPCRHSRRSRRLTQTVSWLLSDFSHKIYREWSKDRLHPFVLTSMMVTHCLSRASKQTFIFVLCTHARLYKKAAGASCEAENRGQRRMIVAKIAAFLPVRPFARLPAVNAFIVTWNFRAPPDAARVCIKTRRLFIEYL